MKIDVCAKNVLWLSRHDLTDAQKEGLVKVANRLACAIGQTMILNIDQLTITKIDQTFENAYEIMAFAVKHQAAVIAAVLPTNLLSDLMAIKPDNDCVCIAKNARKRNPDGEFYFEHESWEIVKKCVYETQSVY